MSTVFVGARKRSGFFRRLLRWCTFVLLVGAATVTASVLVLQVLLKQDVPDFGGLSDYRPKLVTRVYSQEGQLIGEFYREKRVFLPIEQIPRRVIQAFLASEDNRFFDHEGVDPLGILRAAIKNLRAGRVVQGGSTITQQVAKSLLVATEGYKEGTAKKFSRKLKEIVLAERLESRLNKEDILTLYLNQIFLGNQAYGVQAAAHNYFRKTVDRLNLAEAALLGGLPQAPSRYSPFRHPQRARERREYVLRRMRDEGFITQDELEEAEKTPITVYPAPDVSREVTPYFTEQVRRMLVEKYGEDRVLDDGLTVMTTVDVERYRAAEDAVYENLRMVDRRQGFRGPLLHLSTDDQITEFVAKVEKDLRSRGVVVGQLEDRGLYVAVIDSIDRANEEMHLLIGTERAILPLAGMRWARPVDPEQSFETGLLTSIPKTFSRGDVLLVRKTTLLQLQKLAPTAKGLKKRPAQEQGIAWVTLEQEPTLETAVLSTDVESGYVLALIGGYSFDKSEYNRAFQALRQPGSAFKPLIYSAALELKDFTLATTVLDAPITKYDPDAKRAYKPKNFDVKFLGEVTLRMALQNSMNTPAIKVLEAVGVGEALLWAKKLGISATLPPELGLALGAGEVTMAELVDAYRAFANYGQRVERRLVTRVWDRDGRLLEDYTWPKDPWVGVAEKTSRALVESVRPLERVMRVDTGYLITKMMRNVVTGGTGTPAQALGVPVAGKTGTTDDSFDAWFVGYTTDMVTAAWVGYDDRVLPMGRYEQGGRAALPVWLGYMKRAIKGKKTPEFQVPEGIAWVRIDPKTGKRVSASSADGVVEAFRQGTEPSEAMVEAGQERPDEFGKVDDGT